MDIKVLGTGCKTCKKLYQDAKDAVVEVGAGIDVTYITDMAEITSLGIMSTPALIIDGKVKAMGRAPKKKEIMQMIEDEK